MRLFTTLLTLCISLPLSALPLDVEEQRVADVAQQLPELLTPLATSYDAGVVQHRNSRDDASLSQAAADSGQRLWRQAVAQVQSGRMDDRPLYWSRLQLRRDLKQLAPGFNASKADRQAAVDGFERSSRGFNDIHFDNDVQMRILVTGFDPFFLDRHLNQSNPSGLAALALDGRTLILNGRKAQVQAAMIPVRFDDFDQGMIESLLTPYLRDHSVDMVATISMGRDDFDLERFPGRNRSAEAPGNRNLLTGATKTAPLPPRLLGQPLNGPEFVEFSLPVTAMQRADGPWAINDNRHITTLEKGQWQPDSLAQLDGQTSVSGSGGGYLSNEISYRAVLLANQLGSPARVGHIHTPRIAQYDRETETAIVRQIEAMLTQALAAL
ncbi:Pyrrolidone-carboxylate peptidase (N-terminal pyroglutamyl peptidase) [Ferrimonas sediminum]|uniref:Pyrrolidone-carboxylate peptidase (N-terminal pyroglutamyl peptidase) n=1 Tax=Ferrimonas sediminum TaxID=718193 RepID=A0A1G8T5T6_9GAMM|nr:hypothetical protein [Ferrimonas sediminum]SDJ36843.1 Pyrrolidone-carboxylate peptidase (N-terminal pyroglutamyl peptidase) [Ferrimonas sediminum]